MIELRERHEARAWLAAGLANIRVGEAGVEQLAGEAAAIAQVLTERGSLPPVGVVVDVARLLAGGSPRPDDTAAAAVSLRAALRGYRDQVLARLEASVELEPLVDACAALPSAELRQRAVALVIVRLLRRLGFKGGVAIAPGLIRDMARAPVDELDEPITEAEIELCAEAYLELVSGARRVGRLLEPADTFLVERIEALGDLAQRLAIAEIGAVEDAIRRRLPRRIVGRRRDRDRAVMARMTEEEMYPTGGFSAISTSGTLENLVSSELIYMDPGGGGDLFDLRWAEGELLYYTRDDSLFFRGRRKIVFALMPDCTRARVKDAGAAHQRLIAALGLLVVLVDRLETWLDAMALEIQWLFVTDPDGGAPLLDEQALAEILLGPWSERGVAAVEMVRALPAEVEASAATETAALVISASPEGTPAPLIDADVSGALSISAPRPALRWRHRPDDAGVELGDIDDSWVWCATEILAELV